MENINDKKVVDLTVKEFLEIWEKNENISCGLGGKSCGFSGNMMESAMKMMKNMKI